MYKKGDIVLPKKVVERKNWLDGLFHPAVIWDDMYSGHDDFHGIMITGTPPSRGFDNIPMDSNLHFVPGYLIPYKQSYFVNQLFIKFQAWGEFKKVGELTPDGVVFISGRLTNVHVMPFTEFYDRQRSQR